MMVLVMMLLVMSVPILTSVRTQTTTTVTSMLNAAIKLARLAATVTQDTLVTEQYALMMTSVQMEHTTVEQGSAQVGSSYQVIKLGSSYQAFDPMIQDQKTFLIT